MITTKQLLEKELSAIIEKGYQQACFHFQVIPTKKVLFKGFYSPEIGQKILANQEILDNLGLDEEQKRYFERALQRLEQNRPGAALPADRESWIVLNPFYGQAKYSVELVVELAELVAHEVAHAVLFNIDIWRGHDFPHSEITNYLKDYYLRNYDWEKLFK